MHRLRFSLSLVSLATLLSGIVALPVQAQQSPTELANDGMSLALESWPTRSTFATIFGERASSAWIAEHQADLAVGAPAHPVHLAFMAQGNGIGDTNAAARDAILDTLRGLGYAPAATL